MNKKSKIRITALALLAFSLALMLTVSSGISYFVSNKSRENVFVVGTVGLELIENDFPDDKQSRTLAPGDRVSKRPCLKNTGANSEYVFISVSVPLYDVITVNAEHKLNETERVRREIFNLFCEDTDKQTVTAPQDFSFRDIGLLEYSPRYELLLSQEEEDGSRHTYYFGYKKILRPSDPSTDSLFDELQLRSLLEGEVPNDVEATVTVSAYGIQASELPVELRPADEEALTRSELTAIFAVLRRQEAEQT